MMYSIEQLTDKVNQALDALAYNNKVENLYLPIKYTLDNGGKRIRPVLMMMAYNMYRDDVERILPNALAMEVYHNFTLLHDDVMDKAMMRRGKPCVHVKWDENTAILSGDTMLAMAYQLMTENAAFIKEALAAEVTAYPGGQGGRFLCFEPLTMCPYDKRPIVKDMLTGEELVWLNHYHATVREILMPRLQDNRDREWLRSATSPL